MHIYKLKDRVTDLVSNLDHDRSIEGLELIRNQLQYLAEIISPSCTNLNRLVHANEDLLNLYEYSRKLLESLSVDHVEMDKSYTLKSGRCAIVGT